MPLGLNGALGAVAPKHVVEGWESDNQAKLWIPYLIFRRKIDQEDAMWLSMVEAQQYAQVQKQHYSCATLMDAVSVLIFSCCCFQKICFIVWWFSLLCKEHLVPSRPITHPFEAWDFNLRDKVHLSGYNAILYPITGVFIATNLSFQKVLSCKKKI